MILQHVYSFTESLWWLQTQVMKSVTFGKVQTASSADYEKVY